ncbi:MAG: amino acid ABC transporter substrate-binding protein [Burkholderiales bacterium]
MKRRGFLSGMTGIAAAIALASGAAVAQSKDPIKIGCGMSLTGGLAANGKAAMIAMNIWEEDVNAKGGLLGRPIKINCYDDQTNPSTVPGIYSKLIDNDKVDLIVSGYGTNLIAPAMPLAMQRNLLFMGLFGLDVNQKFKYDRYFQIMPTGPTPALGWSEGFFEVALSAGVKTIALVGADAEYPAVALEAAREHVKKKGFKLVYDKTYPPNTVDYTPIVRAIQATNPDAVFVASYPPDSAGMIRAANEIGLKTKMFGGGMVGTQFAALRTQLAGQINGLVNFEFWAPEAADKFPFLNPFLKKYQERAAKEGVDLLGFYLPPYAYAMMQVYEQAITATKGLDQGKLAEYIHKSEFDTVVGKVRFAKNGEWDRARVMLVQYHSISGNDLDQWKKPGRINILYPNDFKTATVKAPYQDNRK